MRVAHLTTVDLSLRYLVLSQLEAVIERGGEAIGISAPGPHVESLQRRGVRHVPLPTSTRGMNPWADLRAAWDLAKILRQERPDILHTHNPKPGLYGRVIGRLLRVPLVVNTVHGLYATPDDSLLKRIAIYGLEAIASRFSDVELVQNPEDLELMTRLRISRPRKTHLLGNGVDLERFKPATSETKASARRRLDLSPDQIAIGFVGRLVEEKGLLELFEAVRELDERYVLLVIGPDDSDKADALPVAVIDDAKARDVRFLGMQPDVQELYAAMDIFALPSHREGFPRTAMEAAASALPIVATNIRGCRQVVTHGRNGLLVPVSNPRQLAAALRQLGEDPGLRSRMGQSSRARAVEQFDEKNVVEIVMDCYVRTGRAKGQTWAVGRSAVQPDIRPAADSDAPTIASLHCANITGGFLPTLGPGFMRLLYRALISWGEAVVLVSDDGHGPLGFVAGVTDTRDFYRYFMRRYGLRAMLVAAPRLLRPMNLRKARETWSYRGRDLGVSAELLSMAVAATERNRGSASRLGTEFLSRMASLGALRVKVVVGSENEGAISAYRKMGFSERNQIEMHAGETSLVLVRG